MTCSRSKPAAPSRDRASTTRRASRCTFDNESTFKERIFLDKKDPNILHDVITVFDHALTQPWTVDKTYRRTAQKYPNWSTTGCLEGSNYVRIDKEFYLLSWDGFLMPLKKGQMPPDTRYFPQAQK